MAKAKPESLGVESLVTEGVHAVMIRHSAWIALQEQAERVGMPAQEFLSMCIVFGIRNPWTVVEGIREEESV